MEGTATFDAPHRILVTGKDGTAEDLMLKFLRDIDRRALLHAK